MKPKLYLHIGTGKAGTTTIQSYLGTEIFTPIGYRQVSAFALGNAWKLSVATKPPKSRDYWVKQRKLLTDAEFETISDTIWREAEMEVKNSGSGRFIASSEFIHSFFDFDKALIAQLHRKLACIFESVHILIYLRDQRDVLKSLYAQNIKGTARKTYSYLKFCDELGAVRAFWDYETLVSIWSEVFGVENLTVAVFDKQSFEGGTLISDFLHRIEVPKACQHLQTDPISENVSPSYGQLQVIRRVNALNGFLPASAWGFLKGASQHPLVGRFTSTAFPSDFDQSILELVSAGNSNLNAGVLRNSQVKLPELAS